MVEKKVNICDICERSVAKGKCSLCKKDMCEECGKEDVIGTISLFLCENCSTKVRRVINYKNYKKFWEEFNKQNNMDEKIIEYINRNLMLKNLGDDEDEEDEEEDEEIFRKLKRRRKTVRKRIMR